MTPFQVGLEGLDEAVARLEAGGEQQMVQMTKERDGEDNEGGPPNIRCFVAKTHLSRFTHFFRQQMSPF